MPERPERALFCLDERLPWAVGSALALVGHPITSLHEQGRGGEPDERLIPWLADQGYVWITRDDAARTAHNAALRRHRLSVVWVRGLDRQKTRIDAKELHLMLTVKLGQMQSALEKARGPLWFLLYLGAGDSAVLRPLAFGESLPGAGRRTRKG